MVGVSHCARCKFDFQRVHLCSLGLVVRGGRFGYHLFLIVHVLEITSLILLTSQRKRVLFGTE